MRHRYYDVVVIGADLAGCLSAALIAKRGFRVLLLGQGSLPPTYQIGGYTLPRRPYTFLSAHSTTARKVLSDLAMGQLFRRRAVPMDPAFQLATPGHRIDAATEVEFLEREFDREFRAVRRAALDLHRTVDRVGAELEQVLARDYVWPPSGFLERREFIRATAHRLFSRDGDGFDPFIEFAADHPIRQLITAPATFASDMDVSQLSPAALLRLYEAWWKGSAKIEGGLTWLRDTLVERIRTHSGDVRLDERAEQILVRRGTAEGVVLAGSAEEIGAGYVVGAVHVSDTAALLPDRAMLGEVFERLGEPRARFLRYTLNIIANEEAFPVGMGQDSFSIFNAESPLSGENLLRLEASPPDGSGKRLLSVEALLPRRGVEEVDRYLDGMRERILGAVTELAPFFGSHIQAVDSPHDGRDLQDYAGRTTHAPARPWTRGPSTMERVDGFPVLGPLGATAMPVRTPVRRLLLCNRQVNPGFGEEGIFLAAHSVSEVVARADPRRSWMRRGLWSRVEL